MTMAPVTHIYFVLIISAWFGSVVDTSVAAGENFVRPSDFKNQSCQFNPCLMLNDYARDADLYFVDNTIFAFLPGTHELDVLLHLKNVVNVTLLASDIDEGSNNNVNLVFSPLVNVSWTNCSNIEISGLNIMLSGREKRSNDYIFASLVFNHTRGSLSRLTFHGNKTMSSTAVFVNESSIKINDLSVLGASSLQGAALHADHSTVDISGQCVFSNNRATDEGGAIALHDDCTCNMTGNISFINNRASNGGAMAFDGGNHNIYGHIPFTSNVADADGGALVLKGGQYSISGKVLFINNSAIRHGGAISVRDVDTSITLDGVAFISNYAGYGGAIDLSEGDHSIAGNNISFIYNHAIVHGGAIATYTGSHNISGNISFENNLSKRHGGAVAALKNNCKMSGTILFINNQASVFGGAAFLEGSGSGSFDSGHSMLGSISFIGNSATTGGGIYSTHTYYTGPLNIYGNISFTNNTAKYMYFEPGLNVFAGAIAAYSSNIELDGNVLFEENEAETGGAIYMENSIVSFSGTQQFVRNCAEQGGAMALSSTSKLTLSKPLTVDFTENKANSYGGAIFVGGSYDNQCSANDAFNERPECFFELNDYYNADNIHLNFINNTARLTGRILYGGNIDKCKLYEGGGNYDKCAWKQTRWRWTL